MESREAADNPVFPFCSGLVLAVPYNIFRWQCQIKLYKCLVNSMQNKWKDGVLNSLKDQVKQLEPQVRDQSLTSCSGALVTHLRCPRAWAPLPSWFKLSIPHVQMTLGLLEGWQKERCCSPDGQRGGPMVWEGRKGGRNATAGLARLRALWGLHRRQRKICLKEPWSYILVV